MHLTPPRQRAPRGALAAALCLTAALLSACVPPSGQPTPTPTPTRTALYASDEEALAAAEAVYREYLEVSAAVLGGYAPVEHLDEVLAGPWLESEKSSAVAFVESGNRIVGVSIFRYIELKSSKISRDKATIVALVCEDISAVDVLDSSGNSLVSPDRYDLTLMEVEFSGDRHGIFVTSRELRDTSC